MLICYYSIYRFVSVTATPTLAILLYLIYPRFYDWFLWRCFVLLSGKIVSLLLFPRYEFFTSVLTYAVHSISFQVFFVQAFKIVVDSWKFSFLLLYILWNDWPNFMISGSNEQLQQWLEYTLLKSDCHSWWISKMQSGREDTLEERYAIKLCFKIWKKCHRYVWNASDCFSTILHESSIISWVA